MLLVAITLALLSGGAFSPLDDEDQADLDYLRWTLERGYETSSSCRELHTPAGVMDDVHAEHLRILREALQRVHERRAPGPA